MRPSPLTTLSYDFCAAVPRHARLLTRRAGDWNAAINSYTRAIALASQKPHLLAQLMLSRSKAHWFAKSFAQVRGQPLRSSLFLLARAPLPTLTLTNRLSLMPPLRPRWSPPLPLRISGEPTAISVLISSRTLSSTTASPCGYMANTTLSLCVPHPSLSFASRTSHLITLTLVSQSGIKEALRYAAESKLMSSKDAAARKVRRLASRHFMISSC